MAPLQMAARSSIASAVQTSSDNGNLDGLESPHHRTCKYCTVVDSGTGSQGELLGSEGRTGTCRTALPAAPAPPRLTVQPQSLGYLRPMAVHSRRSTAPPPQLAIVQPKWMPQERQRLKGPLVHQGDLSLQPQLAPASSALLRRNCSMPPSSSLFHPKLQAPRGLQRLGGPAVADRPGCSVREGAAGRPLCSPCSHRSSSPQKSGSPIHPVGRTGERTGAKPSLEPEAPPLQA